jgi:tetrahydrodipicolinate N-succinyltransferase
MTREYDPDDGIIIELIKMNEQNTNIKLDKLDEKMDTFIESDRSDRAAMKEQIQKLDSKLENMMEEHRISLRNIEEAQKKFIKLDELDAREKALRADIVKFKKFALWGNITFMTFTAYLLFQSDVTINWKSIFSFFKFIF